MLACFDFLTNRETFKRTILHVVILCNNTVAVVNFDSISVSAIIALVNKRDLATHCGLDRRAGRSRNINGLVVVGGLAATRLERLTPAEAARKRAALDRVDGLVLALLVLRDLRAAPRVVLRGVLAVGRLPEIRPLAVRNARNELDRLRDLIVGRPCRRPH